LALACDHPLAGLPAAAVPVPGVETGIGRGQCLLQKARSWRIPELPVSSTGIEYVVNRVVYCATGTEIYIFPG
jgi:hypothetical protein